MVYTCIDLDLDRVPQVVPIYAAPNRKSFFPDFPV